MVTITVGSGEAQERGIIGETPNVAARLQAIAEPDSVVIAESTRKQLGNLFELQDLGARDLKGLAGPARAWTVLRRSSIESRFEALRRGGTPFVGRAEEFELLLRRRQQVKSGQGRVVVLTGEPASANLVLSLLCKSVCKAIGISPCRRTRYDPASTPPTR